MSETSDIRLREAFKDIYDFYVSKPFSNKNCSVSGIYGAPVLHGRWFQYIVSVGMSSSFDECWNNWDGGHVILAENTEVAEAAFLSSIARAGGESGFTNYLFIPPSSIKEPALSEAITYIMQACSIEYDCTQQSEFMLVQAPPTGSLGVIGGDVIIYQGEPFDDDTSKYIVRVEVQRMLDLLLGNIEIQPNSLGMYRREELVKGTMVGMGVSYTDEGHFLEYERTHNNRFENMLRWQISVSPKSMPADIRQAFENVRETTERLSILIATSDAGEMSNAVAWDTASADEISSALTEFADASGFESALDAIAAGVPVEDVIA